MWHFVWFFYYSLQSVSIYNIPQLFGTYYLIDNNAIILKQLRSSKGSQPESQVVNERKGQISFKLTEAPNCFQLLWKSMLRKEFRHLDSKACLFHSSWPPSNSEPINICLKAPFLYLQFVQIRYFRLDACVEEKRKPTLSKSLRMKNFQRDQSIELGSVTMHAILFQIH